ncbi:MAG TPA: TatD family hydrolase [Holophaga sp.]|jgi:TatD DNase family protein|nr:TatD family hydrolase [Holophaga sp.]
MRLFDSHCHLQDERLRDALPSVLVRARAVGVEGFVCCATREDDWEAVQTLAEVQPEVVPLLGLHPWYLAAGARSGWLQRLEGALRAQRDRGPCGVGECGLDFALEDCHREAQEAAFRDQLALACRLDLPISIHCRKAFDALAHIAADLGLPRRGAVIHAFSGSAESVRALQALGFHFGFGCSLANPGNKRAAKALKAIASDRLLLETDSPDMAPRSVPGFETATLNEPANIVLALRAAAQLRGEDVDVLAEGCVERTRKIFLG